MTDVTPTFKNGKPKKKRTLLERCDIVFGEIIRRPGICVDCGATSYIQCAHLFSRRYHATRWHPLNAVPLCRGCHLKWTVRPLEWDEWCRAWWGEPLYDEMRHLALHGPNPPLKAMLEDLRALAAQ